MRCLGLDVGSSSIKGAVLDLERWSVDGVVTEPFPGPVAGLPAGRFEVEPRAIEAGVARVLERLFAEAPEAAAVHASGQMGGVLLVDGGGAPLTRYISWRDQRAVIASAQGAPAWPGDSKASQGGTSLAVVRETWGKATLEALGNELQPGSAGPLLHWLSRRGLLPDGGLLATPADFALARLSGCLPRMDPTQAVGLLDLRAGAWHREAFEALGLGGLRWPELANPREPAGQLRHGGREVPVYAALGDQQCALHGVGLQPDELSINVSTGSQVSRRAPAFEPGPYQSRRFIGEGHLNTITHLPAGRSLNVLVDLLAELPRTLGVSLPSPWEAIAREAARARAEAGGLVADLAFFAGPLGSTGRIDGITTDNLTVGNLFRASFRAMADNYVEAADRLCPARDWSGVVLSGGLARSVPILRRLIEERFLERRPDAPLREPAIAEETLVGLLQVASAR